MHAHYYFCVLSFYVVNVLKSKLFTYICLFLMATENISSLGQFYRDVISYYYQWSLQKTII